MKILFRFPGSPKDTAESLYKELFDLMKKAPYYPTVRNGEVQKLSDMPFVFSGGGRWSNQDLKILFNRIHLFDFPTLIIREVHFELNVTHQTPIEKTLDLIDSEGKLYLIARWLPFYPPQH